ncbi:MAG: glycosyltransferase family 4 protein [Acidobacteriia bacterium]|nr:glycosyltransferase family 4 protein [Terriglobia bacterium]
MGLYALRLVEGLPAVDRENTYIVYGPAKQLSSVCGKPNFLLRPTPSLPSPIWEQCVLPLWASRDRLDLLHCPANTAPLRLPRQVKLVLTLHDVMFLLPPALIPGVGTWRQRIGRNYRRMVVPRVAARADRILTVSDCSRSDILKYIRVDPSKIRVIYEGVGMNSDPASDGAGMPESLARIGAGTNFILALGGYDPRKNTAAVIQSYASLRRSRAISEKLVVVGLPGWESSPFYRTVCQLGLAEDVVLTDYVTDGVLRWLYRSARCFLYPSLYEGFGFPPLEAMASGTPVVTSRVASVPEVVGDSALLVDPTSQQAIQEALLQVLSDDALRGSLIERGCVRAASFRWESTVEQTLAVYRELLGN